MNYSIREMRKEEYSLLGDFLYEAIYIPDGTAAPPKSVIACPELQVYIADFGNSKHDMADDIGILNHGHLLFEGTKEELKTSARAAGFPTDNLEDTFLAMIDEDNRRRGGTV